MVFSVVKEDKCVSLLCAKGFFYLHINMPDTSVLLFFKLQWAFTSPHFSGEGFISKTENMHSRLIDKMFLFVRQSMNAHLFHLSLGAVLAQWFSAAAL